MADTGSGRIGGCKFTAVQLAEDEAFTFRSTTATDNWKMYTDGSNWYIEARDTNGTKVGQDRLEASSSSEINLRPGISSTDGTNYRRMYGSATTTNHVFTRTATGLEVKLTEAGSTCHAPKLFVGIHSSPTSAYIPKTMNFRYYSLPTGATLAGSWDMDVVADRFRMVNANGDVCFQKYHRDASSERHLWILPSIATARESECNVAGDIWYNTDTNKVMYRATDGNKYSINTV